MRLQVLHATSEEKEAVLVTLASCSCNDAAIARCSCTSSLSSALLFKEEKVEHKKKPWQQQQRRYHQQQDDSNHYNSEPTCTRNIIIAA